MKLWGSEGTVSLLPPVTVSCLYNFCVVCVCCAHSHLTAPQSSSARGLAFFLSAAVACAVQPLLRHPHTVLPSAFFLPPPPVSECVSARLQGSMCLFDSLLVCFPVFFLWCVRAHRLCFSSSILFTCDLSVRVCACLSMCVWIGVIQRQQHMQNGCTALRALHEEYTHGAGDEAAPCRRRVCSRGSAQVRTLTHRHPPAPFVLIANNANERKEVN